MNNNISSLWCHSEYFHWSKNPLCSAYSFLLFPNPGELLFFSFTVSIVLTLPECHIVEIILYVVESNCLLSLTNMHLRFLHIFSWLGSILLFSA